MMNSKETLERIEIAIKTGASKNAVTNMVEFLYDRSIINTRTYELALGTINDRY